MNARSQTQSTDSGERADHQAHRCPQEPFQSQGVGTFVDEAQLVSQPRTNEMPLNLAVVNFPR